MKIPCTIMRGGTSKGIILRADTLPADPKTRDTIVLKIFGSPDRRQIDGLAGADPLTSKLALISAPSRPDADIDYTFADVLIDRPVVDYSGYCGNVTSAVAAYAVDEGFVQPIEPVTVVRIHNTNTGRIIKARVSVDNGRVLEKGDVEIAGVPGTAAPIYLDFAGTAGSISGKLLPVGPAIVLRTPNGDRIEASILDIGNPMVLMRASDFGVSAIQTVDEINARQELLMTLDHLRVEGARHLGLIKNDAPVSASIPSVALVGPPANYMAYGTDAAISAAQMDFWAREIFLGSLHKAFGVSETVCTTVAALVPGTVVHSIAQPNSVGGVIRMGHPSGIISADVAVHTGPNGPEVRGVTIVRTARRILDGSVYV